jgi:bifunctional pyridoxal-dependent enzyme with beta-cystathionase and maltose regulon repressor activities
MGLETFKPQGAFYVFPCIKSTGLTSDEFCEQLLNDQKVACVPGTAFGKAGEGFIRVSYAYSLEELKLATEKIKIFLENSIFFFLFFLAIERLHYAFVKVPSSTHPCTEQPIPTK